MEILPYWHHTPVKTYLNFGTKAFRACSEAATLDWLHGAVSRKPGCQPSLGDAVHAEVYNVPFDGSLQSYSHTVLF